MPTETFVYATSASAGVQLRYVQETVAGQSVFTDMGKITDMSSPSTVWAIQSDALGGLGLVNVVNLSAISGLQVSGTVNISGPVAIQSGGTIPISLVSSPFGLGVTVSGGVQVSGAVNVSGFVGALSAGTLPVTIVSATLSNWSGLYLASGIATQSGLWRQTEINVNGSSGAVISVGYASSDIAVPVRGWELPKH